MRLTIKTKLAGAFGVVIVMSMAAGGVAYTKMSDMTDAQTALVNLTKRLEAQNDMSGKIQAAVLNEKNAILAPSAKETEQFAAAAAERRNAAFAVRSDLYKIASEQGKLRLEKIGAHLDRFAALQDETLRNKRAG